ncbi:MAG: tetratricopeptide repeat protein [Myxococcota bacterium]
MNFASRPSVSTNRPSFDLLSPASVLPVGRAPHSGFGAALLVLLLLAGVGAGCSSSVEARLARARELQAEGKMDESIPILIELIESGERDGEILYRYGRALSLTGREERSIWALDAAREDPEWFVRASQQLAIDAHRGGNYEFALEVFDRMHAEAPEEGKDDLMALLLEARILIDSRDKYEKALVLLDDIIERFPEEETAIRMKAVALLGLKRPDEAYELLRASGVDPKSGSESEAESEIAEGGAEAGADGGTGASGEMAAADDAQAEGEDSDLYLEFEDDAREAYWCTVRASFKREAGEIDEATKIADECLEKYPNSIELISESVKLYTGLGKLDRVEEILRKAYEKSPDDASIRAALIQFLAQSDRPEEVEKVLRSAIEKAVAAGRGKTLETASLWVDLAGHLMGWDRVGEALVAFDAANEIIGDKASPDLLLREAEALIRAKEFDEALKMAEKTPVEIHRLMLKGRIAFERGEYKKAFDELGEAGLLWPDNAPIRYYRARAAEGLGEFDAAIEEYRHAIRSDSTMAAARERLARLHLSEGNVREAAAILTFQSPRKPSTPSTAMRILMVEVETRRGTDPDLEIPPSAEYPVERIRREAIEAIARGIRLRTNAKVAARALSEFEKGSAAQIRGAFLRTRVPLLVEQGALEGALSEARAGAKARPDDVDTRVALARALIANGESLDEAEGLLEGVLEKVPSDSEAMVLLGDLEARRGAQEKADAAYDRALRVAPESWPAMAPRVASLVASGKQDEAIARLEVFVDRDAPYEGRGALALARLLPAGEKTRARRTRLARQAYRFGAGEEALALLGELDPAAAEALSAKAPVPPAAAPVDGPSGDAAATAGDDDGSTSKPEKRDEAALQKQDGPGPG